MQRKSTAEIEVLRDLLETQKIQQEKDLTTVQAELVRELLKQSDALIQHRQAIGALLATQEAEIRDKITEIETRLQGVRPLDVFAHVEPDKIYREPERTDDAHLVTAEQ